MCKLNLQCATRLNAIEKKYVEKNVDHVTRHFVEKQSGKEKNVKKGSVVYVLQMTNVAEVFFLFFFSLAFDCRERAVYYIPRL